MKIITFILFLLSINAAFSGEGGISGGPMMKMRSSNYSEHTLINTFTGGEDGGGLGRIVTESYYTGIKTDQIFKIDTDLVSDIRLKDESIIPYEELRNVLLHTRKAKYLQIDGNKATFNLSEKSPIADIQLISGEIIEKQ